MGWRWLYTTLPVLWVDLIMGLHVFIMKDIVPVNHIPQTQINCGALLVDTMFLKQNLEPIKLVKTVTGNIENVLL
jgi:hypothetical protein